MAAALVLVFVIAAGAFLSLRHRPAPTRLTALTTRQIAAQVDPGLVDVVTTLGYQQAEAAGTGLVLTPSGEILTNNHVIEGATSIRVTDIGNGRSYPARVVGYDRGRDVAVLRLTGASGLATVTTGDSASVRVGQAVVGIGNAGGRGGLPSVVTGHVTGLNASVTAADQSAGTVERLHGLIGHNAPIRPGDSGGPLVDTAGQVIGIDTAASSNFRFSGGQTQAFAIPINTALAIARQIEAGQGSATVHIGRTGFLGVAVSSASEATARGVPIGSGVLITGVIPGSPASRIGLAAGDVIVSAAGHRTGSPMVLQQVLERYHPGDTVRVGWQDSSGRAHSASVALTSGPAG